MEVSFGGDYLTFDTTKDGDICEFLNEGEWAELSFQGKTKKVINFRVRCSGKELIYTPGTKQGKILQEAWGKESKSWVGKKFEVLHVEEKMMIRPQKIEKI